MWSSSLSYSDCNLKLAQGLSYFDKEVGKISAKRLILRMPHFLTDSFFSLLLFEYSVIVAYIINVRGCVEIVTGGYPSIFKDTSERNQFSQTC